MSTLTFRIAAQEDLHAVVSLLAIRFTPNGAEDPAGMIELLFAGGGTIRLDVECIDAGMRDLTGPWAAIGKPDHARSDKEGSR